MGRHIQVRGRRVHFKGGRVGGAVLLNSVERRPEVEEGQSNRFVGIITPQVRPANMEGYGLLKNINFGHQKKADKNDRIRFIF